MKTKVNILLDGRSLADIDPRIILQDVKELKPATKNTGVSLAGRIGQLVTIQDRTTLSVQVTFVIACKRDEIEDRARIIQRINAWAAQGGRLALSYRPGQHLDVVCDELPEAGDLRKFDATYTIKLTAYDVPYWVDDRTSSASGMGTVRMVVPGTARTPLELETLASSAVNALAVTDGRQLMEFDFGAAMPAGSILRIRHDGMIMVGTIELPDGSTINALEYRTPESNDELWLSPGTRELTVTGSTATLIVRGRWH